MTPCETLCERITEITLQLIRYIIQKEKYYSNYKLYLSNIIVQINILSHNMHNLLFIDSSAPFATIFVSVRLCILLDS